MSRSRELSATCQRFETMDGSGVQCCSTCHASLEKAGDDWPAMQTLFYDDDDARMVVCCNVAALVRCGLARKKEKVTT